MAEGAHLNKRIQVTVSGVVQGVGFRPFVVRIARACGLSGYVRNDGGIVTMEAEGADDALAGFLDAVRSHPPRGTRIVKMDIRWDLPALNGPDRADFVIRDSEAMTAVIPRNSGAIPAVIPPPDAAVCDDCLREMRDPGDPRYRNPFISCTVCGPRYSIIERLPYDRENTAMGRFPMCALCASQYGEPSDRRFHAQTVCCNDCGPVLRYLDGDRVLSGEDALQAAIGALSGGGIVAIKGIGGYHLACSPFRSETVRGLRAAKGREEKPFAVMFADMAQIRQFCAAGPEEETLLLSGERPIVLLERKPGDMDRSVYGNSRYMGAFLPYTPLQHRILSETGPLVMTSANRSGLPIIIDDEEMLRFYREAGALYGTAEFGSVSGILTHDRAILRRLDDSVAAVIGGETQMIRRARGYVPLPVAVAAGRDRDVLACGPHMKNTISLSKGAYIYPGAELGDLDSEEKIHVYRDTVVDMEELLGIRPELALCDMHPDYATTAYARGTGLPVLQVQHHFAHIASVMAENDLDESVIGVAFDGTGYGTDGSVWGGEFLIASPRGFTRAAHVKPVRLFGSDESVRQGWKTAACMLYQAGVEIRDGSARMETLAAALKANIHTVRTSGMGRFFDAASAVLGICEYSDYEGQCAIELENAAAGYERLLHGGADAGRDTELLPFALDDEDGVLQADLLPCIRALCDEKIRGGDTGLQAYRFHITVSRMILEICMRLKETSGLNTVALSGGVFQNRILLTQTLLLLKDAGFRVYTNRIVPPGDGGISLGQAYIGRFADVRMDGQGKTMTSDTSADKNG